MYKKLCLFLSLAILISGCNFNDEQQDDTDVSSSVSDTQGAALSSAEEIITFNNHDDLMSEESEKIYLRNFPAYDEIKSQYPDKTVLVWSFERNMFDSRTNIRTRELNAYLDQQGYDFVLCFEAANTMVSDDKYAYINYIRDKIANHEPVDIVYNSARFISSEGIPAYNASVYADILEPLDKYLEGEAGQRLYRLMPKNFWRSLEINGAVYGFNGSFSQLTSDFGYYVNKQLADQYGFDVEKPILEQIDILEAIKEHEAVDVAAAFNVEYMCESSAFGVPDTVIDGVYIENGEIKSVFDNKNYLDNLRLFNTLNSKELLRCSNLDDEHKESAFLIINSKNTGAFAYKNQEPVEYDYFGTKIEMIPVFKGSTSIRTANAATGICAYSENKEKAFEALSLILTDPYINNLMSYGIEDEDYTKAGDHVVLDPVHGNPFGKMRFSNKILCYPSENDYDNMSEIYTDAFNEVNDDNLGFVFDGRAVEDEIIKVTLVLQSDVKKLLLTDDFDAEIKNIEQSLTKAGLNTIIDECKKQYAEWEKGDGNE